MMDDELAAAQQALIEPETIAAPATEPTIEPTERPKRTRTRRKRVDHTDAINSFEEFNLEQSASGPAEPEKRTRTRRASAKLNGDDIVSGVVLGSQLVAMMSNEAHWQIDPSEVKPWAKEAAELLNRIPAKYVRAVTDINGFVVVGVGIYSCVNPRIRQSEHNRMERRRAAAVQEADRTVSEAQAGAVETPWGTRV